MINIDIINRILSSMFLSLCLFSPFVAVASDVSYSVVSAINSDYTVWDGDEITFTKSNGANPGLEITVDKYIMLNQNHQLANKPVPPKHSGLLEL